MEDILECGGERGGREGGVGVCGVVARHRQLQR
jgi:hypothetical protein